MNVDSILVSDYATIQGGKLTVVGVFDRIGPLRLPARIPTMCVSVVIHAHHDEAGTEHEGEIRIVDQHRKAKQAAKFRFRFPEKADHLPGLPLRHVYIWTILAAAFEAPGAFAFEVYIDGTYHAATSFAVLGLRPPEGRPQEE